MVDTTSTENANDCGLVESAHGMLSKYAFARESLFRAWEWIMTDGEALSGSTEYDQRRKEIDCE